LGKDLRGFSNEREEFFEKNKKAQIGLSKG
jgi:hypothetical protein